ncbi:MAG: inositol-3-phosphate synthase [Thermoguttaceae bacterium]|jgi:myo-inositol-1-phosphate synthase
MAKGRIGIWLVGARGGVASTAIVGLTALKKGLIQGTGLVTELPCFAALPLVPWSDFVVGGHEIRNLRLCAEAMRVATEMRAASTELIAQCGDELEQIDARIRPGTIHNVGATIARLADCHLPAAETPWRAIDRLQQDLGDFTAQNQLAHVVVVNVASTEPPRESAGLPQQWEDLVPLLHEPSCPLPASSLYAIAALDLGCSYVNFTPSLGAAPPAIDELARLRGARHAGCDGKTGETLLKSVLAPMFARRNLQVLSWVGHNIFGNMDGKVLDDPQNKQAKIASKEHLLGEILGYRPQTLVSIEYVASLGDWKTAWDHVHFAGFLGTPMTLQFTWQGCDSVLAAPLVLDLVRFSEWAWRRGESGALRFLASFFKSPLGVEEPCFDNQFRMLQEWALG